MEHGLLSSELRDRGKNTTGIASQQNDICGMLLSDARDLGIFDVVNGVSTGKRSVLG
jgi:hypothetical protein